MLSLKLLSFLLILGVVCHADDYPYRVSIHHPGFFGRTHLCGGALLSNRFILTSAFCSVRYDDPRAFTAVVGNVLGGEVYSVEKKFEHPDFSADSNAFEFDIALLKVDREITFSDTVAPIGLVHLNFDLDSNFEGTLVGFNVYLVSGGWESETNEVQLKTVDNQTCQDAWTTFVQITDNILCVSAVDETLPTNMCGREEGDFGSPFVVSGAVAGIASFGVDCTMNSMPGLFTRLNTAIIDWIMNTVSD